MQLRDIASVYLTDAGLLAVLLQTGPVSRTKTLVKVHALLKTFPCVPAAFEHHFPRGEMVEAGADLVSAAGCYQWKIENEHNNTLKTKGYYKVG